VIKLTTTPKTSSITYRWTPENIGIGNNHRTNLPSGEYKVLAIDQNSCKDSLKIELTTKDCNSEFKVFPAFTPNGDGQNDFFEIRPLKCQFNTLAACFPNNELFIYNRFNHAIYHKAPYNNEWNGEQYPAGAYYYIFFPDKNNKKNKFTGWISLLR
jgi:gliding motility-associated-like protein